MKIDLQLLIEFLDEYLPFIDSKIPTTINKGGCGIFAYHLSKTLTKMRVPNNIVCLFSDFDRLFGIRENTKKFVNKGKVDDAFGVSHIVVSLDEYGDFFFDSEGKTLFSDIEHEYPRKANIVMSHGRLLKMINEPLCGWNKTFDRSQEIHIEEWCSTIPQEFDDWVTHKHLYAHGSLENKVLNKYTREHLDDSMFEFLDGLFG